LDEPFSPKEFFTEIAPLLPKKFSPLTTKGNGFQGAYLAEINSDLAEFIIKKSKIQHLVLTQLKNSRIYEMEEAVELEIREGEIQETEKEQLILARRGQGIFRNRVEKIEYQCRVTGVCDKQFLIASHIKPWKDSNDKEKLDGNNGLLLSPHVDKLFDNGWLSFSDDGDILVADETVVNVLMAWGIDPRKKVGQFRLQQKQYLDFHRQAVFKTNLET
jgi:predicted restriction endonuclease